MIFARRGIDIEDYPTTREYLAEFLEQLEPKPEDWKGSNWPGRKLGFDAWYEIQDRVDYWPIFEILQIGYQEIQFHPNYRFDLSGHFTNNKCFDIPTEDLYLLAVLNSPLIWWHNWRYLTHMKNETLTPAAVKMVDLPIASPSDELRFETDGLIQRQLEA